ncbi:MAG TPA: serine--tRNA ligase, partial [Dehalococcoidia bacterium]
QFIREHPEAIRRSIEVRHTPQPLDQWLKADTEFRQLDHEVNELRARRNEESRRIGRTADPAEREKLIAAATGVRDRLDELEPRLRLLEELRNALLLEFPNPPDDDVPPGEDERDNVVRRQSGEPQPFDFEPRPHWELGERLGIIDFERGVKLSGSRFYVLKGAGSRLERALIAFMLDLHGRQGYTEVYVPFVVKEAALLNAGQLPKFRDNLYRDVEDDIWLVPTAEVPVTNLHAGEILDVASLPLDYVAYTPCFRREKMSAGRDVRGIKRGHQFDKVEMYKFCAPEESPGELQRMLADAIETCKELGFTYRVVQLCGGDLGFAASLTYDIEVWAPGCGEWLEVSSCSNVRDFQARRANVRFRRAPGERPEFVHTLNGSGLGLPRTLIAVLENYQQPDGSIVIPEALRPYLGGLERISA